MSIPLKFFNANFFFGYVVIRQTAALKLNLLKHNSVFLYMKNLEIRGGPRPTNKERSDADSCAFSSKKLKGTFHVAQYFASQTSLMPLHYMTILFRF
jgi:hypothetical protein